MTTPDATIKVLLGEYSDALARQIQSALCSYTNIEFVERASNGLDVLTKLKAMDVDVLVTDLVLPKLDGIEVIQEVRRFNSNLPIIIFSDLTYWGAEATGDALNAGATDFALKPGRNLPYAEAIRTIANLLAPKILHWSERYHASTPLANQTRPLVSKTPNSGVVLIGGSLGAPKALATILRSIESTIETPILVAQHTSLESTSRLAEWLGHESGLQVVEAANGDPLSPRTVYVAPGGRQLTLTTSLAQPQLRVAKIEPNFKSQHTIDCLFASAANVFGNNTLAIVLTGMGHDGLEGARVVKQNGGLILVQDRNTSVVWGMPSQISAAGIADRELSPIQIAKEISRFDALHREGQFAGGGAA